MRMSRQELLKKRQEEEGERWKTYLLRNFLGMIIRITVWLGQMAAVATCMTLSWKRLKKQDYVDAKYIGQDDHRNIRRSLNIFYGLVFAQGIIFICMRLKPNMIVIGHTGREYSLHWPLSRILPRYAADNYLDFISGNVRTTLNMDLVTYARNLVLSNTLDDQLLGIGTMDRIFRSVKYRSLALTRLRASLDADSLGKLLNMLGCFRTTEEKEIRGHAARVVLKLTPDLVLPTCPDGTLHLISSLCNDTLNEDHMKKNLKRNMDDADLLWFGLRILDKLTDNPRNCKEANKDLLLKILDLTTNLLCAHGHGIGTLSNSWVEQEIIPLLTREDNIPLPVKQKIDQEIIVGISLNILSKLMVAAPGTVRVLSKETSRDFHLLTNTGMVWKHVGATRVISCLAAVDDKVREEIGTMLPEVLGNLKGCLLSKAPYVNISKVAAKVLLLECTTSDDHLNHIQLFIEENHRLLDLEDQLPVSAFIQELDMSDQLSVPYIQSMVQRLDLEDLLSAPRISLKELEKIVNVLSPQDGEKERRRMLIAHFEGRHLPQQVLRVVKKIICAEGGELKRSMHAKLLQNLRAYSGEEDFNAYMQVIDKALPTVLKAIVDEVSILEDPSSTDENLGCVKYDLWVKGGKVLESFIGLAVQICSRSPPLYTSSFADTLLEHANLTVDTWVKKLKKILELYKSPTTDFPCIRRSTLELLNWMVENDSSNIEILLQCGVYEQLHQVAKTARKLERFKLFHCGHRVPAEPSTPCISSLATELQQQLQRSPSFKERSNSCRENSSAISVLII
ncbi:hypothetical protein BS78_08G170100 [Paspalum vaginatum]|nr:hypothetical protein BS78_08G170100 [Paspalum vaginatum]